MTKFYHNIFLILIILFGFSAHAQLKGISERKNDLANTPSEHRELMINFLDGKDSSNFYSNNYCNGKQYFFIQKHYLVEKFGIEVYLFGATSSHDKIYMMFWSEADIRFIDFMNCGEDWQTIISFIDKHIKECNKIPFLNTIMASLNYTIENNRYVPEKDIFGRKFNSN